MHISETDQLQQSTTSPTPISPVHKVEALICSQSWLQTSQRKLSEREAAEEVQAYEIREEFVSKDCTDKQHHIGFIELDT